MAFLYPIYGKDMAVAYQAVDFSQAILAQFQDKGSNEYKVMEGLFSIGGFVFFNDHGNPQAAHALLAAELPGFTAPLNFSLNTKNGEQVKAGISQELTTLRTRHKEKKHVADTDVNLARITLGFFRDNQLATYFQFSSYDQKAISFGYQAGESAGEAQYYSYVLDA